MSVTKLGSFAFNNCTSLEEAWIGKKVDAASTGTFNGCTKLNSVNRYDYSEPDDPVPAGDFFCTITNPDIDGRGEVQVLAYNPDAERLVVPNTVDWNGQTYRVTRLNGNIVLNQNTSLKSLVIGSNVVEIGNNAFANCTELVSVTGGAKLKKIGARAFSNCPKLKVFSISSKTLSKIGPYAFSGDKALKALQVKKTTKLTKSGVKKSLKGSSVKTVKVKKSKVKKYKKIFKKKNCGKKVKVKK